MTRTYRNFGHRWAKNGKYYNEAKEEHTPGFHPGHWYHAPYGYDFRKNHIYHGRDGGYKTEIGMAENFDSTPNGWFAWDEVWGMYRKRKAKFRTGRYRRMRDQKICKAEVLALYESED